MRKILFIVCLALFSFMGFSSEAKECGVEMHKSVKAEVSVLKNSLTLNQNFEPVLSNSFEMIIEAAVRLKNVKRTSHKMKKFKLLTDLKSYELYKSKLFYNLKYRRV